MPSLCAKDDSPPVPDSLEEWKAKAIYYTEKCSTLGNELAVCRHHLSATRETVRTLLGQTNGEPFLVPSTLEAHW